MDSLKKYYLAIDIGASSGRHIVGFINDKGCLETNEVFRFKNELNEVDGHLTWDMDAIFREVKQGIKIAIERYKIIESMSIDTWGVDYVLLKDDKIFPPVYAYRDNRTKNAIKMVHQMVPFEKIYNITGCQFQEFNTIYQLYDDLIKNRLNQASDYLMIPEYLIYLLTGVKVHEYTNASTTSLLSLETNDYSEELISSLGFPKKLFSSLIKPGTIIGNFSKEIEAEVGGNMKVVLCATHDTASAVEGLDIEKDTIYISSGTWSLLGVKLDKGIHSEASLKANYSNEYGPIYIRFQKNIMGLWIIQGLQKQIGLDFTTLMNLARTSHCKAIFDVNDNRFLSSLDMKKTINDWFKDHHYELLEKDEDFISSALYSLASSYQVAIEELEQITNKHYDTIVITGGGAKNDYLNELTEKLTHKKVIAQKIEATSIGNLKVQMQIDKIEKTIR